MAKKAPERMTLVATPDSLTIKGTKKKRHVRAYLPGAEGGPIEGTTETEIVGSWGPQGFIDSEPAPKRSKKR